MCAIVADSTEAFSIRVNSFHYGQVNKDKTLLLKLQVTSFPRKRCQVYEGCSFVLGREEEF